MFSSLSPCRRHRGAAVAAGSLQLRDPGGLSGGHRHAAGRCRQDKHADEHAWMQERFTDGGLHFQGMWQKKL